MSTSLPHAFVVRRPAGLSLPWWQRRVWRDYLQTRLLRRCRRRFTLHLSAHGPLGATDQERRQVYVNPTGLPFPDDPVVRALVRHAPHDADAWQQQLTVDLIEHESGHVRFSGTKPSGTLGWLWNVLEDARQERLMALAVPEDRERFERLGDAAWLGCEPTSDLLAWCLLWRWEATHVPGSPQAAQSKMEYTHADWQLWELAIRPLVERAWAAPSSDDVTAIAEAILDLLGRDADAAPPALGWCVAHGRRSDAPDAITTGDEGSGETELPPLPGGSGGAGRGQGLLPGEADPVLVLTEVEGAARELARALRPPTPNTRPVPHASRGVLQVERAMLRSLRPFEQQQVAAPVRSHAIVLMVDESGSMGDGLLAGSRAWGAVRAAMLLDRACELAQVPLQIWGFEDGETPRVMRSWSDAAGAAAARRRIAGITGRGGTQLAPILTAALMTLQQRPEQVRWLVLTLDGELADDDALRVRALLPAARRARIQVQPVFLGSDQGAIDTVRDLVGSCLAAPSPADLTRKLSAWIRAAL